MARDFTQNSEQYLTHIDAEIARLQQLRQQVTGAIKGDRAITSQQTARKGMSADGRRRVAEAQRARWAKLKKSAGTAAEKKASAAKPRKAAAKKLPAA